jgi:hypothetical protein
MKVSSPGRVSYVAWGLLMSGSGDLAGGLCGSRDAYERVIMRLGVKLGRRTAERSILYDFK